MFGLDIARYQNVRDWSRVKKFGVEFISVKHTDGFGLAPVQRATAQVKGCKSVGIAVGGYHFAQKGDPHRQANVFDAELKFQGALDIWPMLDIESAPALGLRWTGTEANQFTRQFVDRMLELGYAKVLVYSSTSELTAMSAQRIYEDYAGRVLIWAARYGSNNGANQGIGSYKGDVHVHQYTSMGIVPGIDGRCDLNDAKVDISTTGDIDMALSDSDVTRVAQAVWTMQIANLNPGEGRPASLPAGVLQYGTNMGAWASVDEDNETQQQLAALETKFTGLLTEQQAALLAAFDERPTSVNMTDANIQQLLAGMSTATVKAFRDVAGSILAATDKED